MDTIDRLAEMMGTDASETRQALAMLVAFISSLILALGLLGAWVATVLYWIMPLSLDGGVGVSFIRGALAVGGGLIIGGAYLFGLHAVTQ